MNILYLIHCILVMFGRLATTRMFNANYSYIQFQKLTQTGTNLADIQILLTCMYQ